MSIVTCSAESIYDYTRAQRNDYVTCQKRSTLIWASIVTGVFVLILIGAIVASVSMENIIPGLIAAGAFAFIVGGSWIYYGVGDYFANSRFDQHDRKVELGLEAAGAGATEADVLIQLRQEERNQQNFNRAISRPIAPIYGSPIGGVSNSAPNFGVGFGNNY